MSKKKWELKLKQVETLVASSNESLFARTTLLVEVFDDQRFHEHHNGDMDAMSEHLDKYLGDYGIDFFDARAILKHYPQQEEWKTGSIRSMLAEALDREVRQATDTTTVTYRPRVRREEYEKLQAEAERLRKSNEAYQEENTALRSRIHELEHEIAVATGRIEQLEKLVRPVQEASHA